MQRHLSNTLAFLASLLGFNAYANQTAVTQVNLNQQDSDLIRSTDFSESVIAEIFANQGVQITTDSEVLIHEENRQIDLDCFNCLIIPVDAGLAIQHSKNSDGPDPVFK